MKGAGEQGGSVQKARRSLLVSENCDEHHLIKIRLQDERKGPRALL